MHWTVGKVRIAKVVELETDRQHALHPAARDQRGNSGNCLVDPRFANEERLENVDPLAAGGNTVAPDHRRYRLGNDKQGRNVPTWNNRKDPFLDTLTAAAFRPTASTRCYARICMSIIRLEHRPRRQAKWVQRFANASYVFGRTELEHWRDRTEGRRIRRCSIVA